ncbi:24992_t:CDS:2 [Cetraspora pellucida]|uniref:24992_t:CDS:1 n=1 Tax=Cetraspora pellucida TaxID=1433469 RepID=A0A9N8YW45_9GLOM|nr:24992_t:CDS:2 [Cetraspora pellucida]
MEFEEGFDSTQSLTDFQFSNCDDHIFSLENKTKVLEQLNKVTNQVIPKTVYTDADPAISAALHYDICLKCFILHVRVGQSAIHSQGLLPEFKVLNELKSFLYDASEILYEWDNNVSETADILENRYLEDNYEWHQTCLKTLLQPLQHEDIMQIWTHLFHFCIPNVFTSSLQKSANEKFISSKTHELKLLEENKDASNVESQPAITNLFITKHHGRSPKCYKSLLEHVTNTQNNKHSPITNNNRTQEKNRNKCANCRNYRHNVRTCTYED